jgi:hypothetical protein
MPSIFLGVMCDLTLGARTRRVIRETAETSGFKQWLNLRASKLGKNIRRKIVKNSKYLSYFYDQVQLD